ncbi:type II toxin-antitoxin system Phd/YefM family antitoxin [Methylonatrum kenyense]|uniref:type II toxin-antitoxin system Phd/YefM family antitoxin n=1 Tax=Methylonatrum kenyense TaxID=455253 RepID=UPI0020C029F4|nr:type II toxin-antitoxin system Phd/YefM family antitoxin [Methylonatrum kenyense]MCK8515864.1 type II toxin-antitoxin system Phd/YefM family antitoxin [Methylonatrum kenyense]
MKTFSASEAKQRFGALIEAANREPVKIQRHQRDVAVVLSMDEYERLIRFNVNEFQRFCDQIGTSARRAGVSEEELNKLLNDS